MSVTMSTTTTVRFGAPATTGRLIGAIVAAAAIAGALNSVVAAIAHSAGAADAFKPLQASTFVGLGVMGILFAAIAWIIIRARAKDPVRVMRVLVPAVVALSLIPDVAVGANPSGMTGTSWGAVIALMVMHFVVASVAVTSFQLLLPLRSRAPR